MRKFILVFCLLAFPAHAGEWVEGSLIGVPFDNGKNPRGIRVSTVPGAQNIPLIPIPTNQWTEIDLANGTQWDRTGDPGVDQPDIPHDTLAVFLSGIMIVTHPGTSVICNLAATFRAPGDNLNSASIQMQVVEAAPSIGHQPGGARTNAAVWVPVANRRFEFFWTKTPGCPSAINLSLQAYVR